MTGPLAAAILRELLQELIEEEEALAGATGVGVSVREIPDGRLQCEVRFSLADGDLEVSAGVFAPRQASRRRLRIEMLKAIARGLDAGKEG